MSFWKICFLLLVIKICTVSVFRAQLKKQSSTSNKPLENKKIVLVGKLKQTKVAREGLW